MKKSELAEIKKMDIKTLGEKTKKAKEGLAGLTLDKSMGKLANLREIKSRRRDLAQILTILKQKQLLEELESRK